MTDLIITPEIIHEVCDDALERSPRLALASVLAWLASWYGGHDSRNYLLAEEVAKEYINAKADTI